LPKLPHSLYRAAARFVVARMRAITDGCSNADDFAMLRTPLIDLLITHDSFCMAVTTSAFKISSIHLNKQNQQLPRVARVTFLCLCKEKSPKETQPSVTPGAGRRVRGPRGVFRRHVHVPSKNARRPAARPAGLIRKSRRSDGQVDQRQDQQRSSTAALTFPNALV
jgi:hypothetical protein